MSEDTKIVVGLSSLVFGVLHWVGLFILAVKWKGAYLAGMALYYMDYPLGVLWRPGDSTPTALYLFYILAGGTIMFMLAGVPVGFGIRGVQRLFKWLNDERWDNADKQ